MTDPRGVLYLNPPLLVPPDPIDCPPFAFLGAHHGAAALERLGAPVTLRDAFTEVAPARLADGWLRLGPEPERFAAACDGTDEGLVVVHFSPFARLERNLAQVLEPLLRRLRRPGRTVVLADGYLAETHYVSTDPRWLFDRLAGMDGWLKREPEKPLEALWKSAAHPRLLWADGAWDAAGGGSQAGQWWAGVDAERVERTVRWLREPALEGLIPGYDGGRAIFPYVASRGCPFRCAFCTSERERRWAGLPLPRVRGDLERLAAAGVEEIWLLDPIANANRERFGALLEIVEDLGLRLALPNGLRIDRLDPGALARLARVAERVPMSVESADPEVLDGLGKKLSLERARATLAAASEAGLSTQVHYVIGAPGEAGEAVNRTLGFALDAEARWGAEPLVQLYVAPERIAVPTGRGRGLPDDFYAAFGSRPLAQDGALPPARLERFLDTFRRKRAQPSQAKLIVNLSYRCNNHCLFCSVGDRVPEDGPLAEHLEALEDAANRGMRLLDLDGGEPMLYPHLLEVIDHARALGFERITVTTNGRMLAYADVAPALVERGVELLISLHGADAATHDALTRVPGSHAQTLKGIRGALEAGAHPGVNTTVVRDNLGELERLGALLVELGVGVWNVQLVTPFGSAVGRQELAPDWDETVTTLQVLLRRYDGQIAIQLVGLPPCGLGAQEQHALDDHHKAVREMRFVGGEQVSLGGYLDTRRSFAAACGGCERRLLCGGYWDFTTRFEPPTRPASAIAPAEAGAHERAQTVPDAARVRLLDIIPGYACNLVCDYCSVTEQMREVNLTYEQVVPLLEQGRAQGIDYVSFGGGEPTIRPDILRLTRTARRLGYTTIRYQTNGFMFAYPEFTRRALAAGLNKLHLSFMTCREKLYDRITGFDGSRRLALRALETLRDQDVTLVGDLILKADTYAHVAETVAYFHERGVNEFYLWLVSLTDRNRAHPESLRPVSEMRPAIEAALDYGAAHGIRVMSRHIPACMLPDHVDQVMKLGDEDVWVVTPETSFWLLESVISANRFAPRCAGCARQGICWGLREDYLARYGDAEVEPYR